MNIAAVQTRTLRIPAKLSVSDRVEPVDITVVVVHANDGLTGMGISRGVWGRFTVQEMITKELTPFLLGRDPMAIERIWKDAFWDLGIHFHRREGVAAQAMSAVDQALWDLKGKYLNQPVYRLLGGASDEIEVYTTFGWNALDREELVELARQLVAEGHDKLKIQAVAARRGQDIEEDVARVRLVREAVGGEIKIMFDANANYNYVHALKLAKRLEPYDLTFFDDPVHGRDVRMMAELRRHTTVPLATRAAYENIWSARETITSGAVDVMQMNVLDGGGYSECQKVAHMAEMYHLPVATGGAFYLPNSHLIAGVTSGWMTECHLLFAAVYDGIETSVVQGTGLFTGEYPRPKNGRLVMTDAPGIGWELDPAKASEYAVAE